MDDDRGWDSGNGLKRILYRMMSDLCVPLFLLILSFHAQLIIGGGNTAFFNPLFCLLPSLSVLSCSVLWDGDKPVTRGS